VHEAATQLVGWDDQDQHDDPLVSLPTEPVDEGHDPLRDRGALGPQHPTVRRVWTQNLQTPLRRFLRTETGWGAAMATDTAFALGVLALAGPGVPDRVRTYMLTFAIADDVAGIVVIALAYSRRVDLAALGAGLALLGLVIGARRLGVRHGPGYLLLGVAAWIAFFKSGVDPVVVGLVMGLLALAYPATRRDLERAFESFRLSVTTRAQNRSQCTSESASTITS
jgi:hypothetical protein